MTTVVDGQVQEGASDSGLVDIGCCRLHNDRDIGYSYRGQLGHAADVNDERLASSRTPVPLYSCDDQSTTNNAERGPCRQRSSKIESSVDEIGHLRSSALDEASPWQRDVGGDGLQPLRRIRSKSVLVPPTTARLLAKQTQRGSIQTEIDRYKMSIADVLTAMHSSSTASSAAATHTKSVQTYVSYGVGERLRSVSLATIKSRTYSIGRDSNFSDMCIEYMRLNGTLPGRFQSRSLQTQPRESTAR